MPVTIMPEEYTKRYYSWCTQEHIRNDYQAKEAHRQGTSIATSSAVREAAADSASLNRLDSNKSLLEAPSTTSDNGLRTPASQTFRSGQLVFEPQDFKLDPGIHSHIDRESPPCAEDAFRCISCTDAICQVED